MLTYKHGHFFFISLGITHLEGVAKTVSSTGITGDPVLVAPAISQDLG